MNIDKSLRIDCEAKTYIELKDLHHFQGDLKSIKKEDLFNLKQSLIKDGFPMALHVWTDKKGKHQLIDGHHRRYALLELESEGWFIPPLPCVIVKADSKKEAAKIVMISNSHYSKLSQESISDFMIEMELQLPDIELLDIPELKNIIPDVEDDEFNPTNDGDEKKHKVCPHCGEKL